MVIYHGKKWKITLNESKRIVWDCAMVYLPPITIIYHKNPPNVGKYKYTSPMDPMGISRLRDRNYPWRKGFYMFNTLASMNGIKQLNDI